MIDKHLTVISTNPEFKRIRECIIAGVLSFRVRYIGGTLSFDQTVNNIIQRWYQMASYIRINVFSSASIVVFRTIHQIPNEVMVSKQIPHPIPFSCSLSKNFASSWSEGYDDSILLCIIVPRDCLYTIITDDTESEIIVESGIVHIEKEFKDFYLCRFTSYNFFIK